MKNGKRSGSFQGRSFARAVAFQVIYEHEVNPGISDSLDEEFIDGEFAHLGNPEARKSGVRDKNGPLDIEDEEDSILSIADSPLKPLSSDEIQALTTFAKRLIHATLSDRDELDRRIEKASDHWRLDRMSATDRNLLRMATAEIFLGTPEPVVINEAIELGKKFGSADSASFINGILGRIVRELRDAAR